MESAVLTVRQAKPRVVETASDPEQRKAMLTAPVLLELRNVRIHPVPIRYPERNGSVVARNL